MAFGSEKNNSDRDIAIVGMGCRYPGAPDLNSFWTLLEQGTVQAEEIPQDRWNNESFYDKNPRRLDKTYARKLATIADVKDFDPEYFGILPRRARLMDPQQRVFLDVARAAFEDSGYGAICPERNTGVYLGISVSEHHQLAGLRLIGQQIRDGNFGRVPEGLDEAWKFLLEDAPQVQGYSMIGQMLNMAAANVSQCFDLQGPSYAADAACSSSLVALGEAVLHLRGGLCDTALVGGVYLALRPDNLVTFSRIGALSISNACRPFDEKADGFVLGEGAGAVVLKRLSDAQRDGDQIRGVIKGFSINADGRGEGPMTPRKDGQMRVLRRAYKDAGVSPASIQYIEAHGTGTRVGDETESASICDLISETGVEKVNARLGAVKANIGHTIAAAGIAGVIKNVLAMERGVVPPLAGFDSPRETRLSEIGVTIPTKAEAWPDVAGTPRRSSVSSFGFGGTNVHAVLEEGTRGYSQRTSRVANDKRSSRAQLFLLAAPDSSRLVRYAERLAAVIENEKPELADVAYSLATRAHDGDARAAFVASSSDEVVEKLRGLASRDAGATQAGHDVFLSSLEGGDLSNRKLAFLFPGQGAQTVNQCRSLYDGFPVFKAEFDRLASLVDPQIAESIFPTVTTDTEVNAASINLQRTEICQPAMVILEMALMKLLTSLGVSADAHLGHSLGEFAAASAAGMLSSEELIKFVSARGNAMAGVGRGVSATSKDAGAMAAVGADEETVAREIASISGIAIANLNHPRQTVISGSTSGIEAAEAKFKAQKIPATRLAVSHGFHSPIMEPIDGWAESVVENLGLSEASIAVISSVDVCDISANIPRAKKAWKQHATSAIRFVDAIEFAQKIGITDFVQIAGGRRLANMVVRTLESVKAASPKQGEGAGLLATAFDTGSGDVRGASDSVGTFLSTLAQLFVRGQKLTTQSLSKGQLISLPPTPLKNRELWILRPPSTLAPLPTFESSSQAQSQSADRGAQVKKISLNRTEPQEETFESRLEKIATDIENLRVAYSSSSAAAPSFVAQGGSVVTAEFGQPSSSAPASNSPRSSEKTGGNPANLSRSLAKNEAPLLSNSPGFSRTGESDKSLSATVVACLSRVTAIPEADVNLDARLVADLGFDSLMAVEFTAALSDAMPEIGELPASLLSEDLSISELVSSLSELGNVSNGTAATVPRPADENAETVYAERSTYAERSSLPNSDLSAGKSSARDTKAEEPLQLFSPVWVESTLPSLGDLRQKTSERPLNQPFEGDVLLVTRGGEASRQLQYSLEATGHQVIAVPPEARPNGEAKNVGLVVDAQFLEGQADGANGLANADGSRANRGIIEAAGWARRAANYQAGYLLVTKAGTLEGAGGFVRSLSKDWSLRLVKFVEFAGDVAPADAARLTVQELFSTNQEAEIRYLDGQRFIQRLLPYETTEKALPLGARIVISGGSSGLGAKLALYVAGNYSARVLLLGRRPESEVQSLLEEVAHLGGTAVYSSCDIADASAVADAASKFSARYGAIQFAVHAAGVTQDAAFESIAADDFEAVVKTKVDGAAALWQAVYSAQLQGFIAYGSWAGRFGNRHQTAYAAGNRGMADLVQGLGSKHRQIRVTTLELPPWQGGGMVDSLPSAVQEKLRTVVPFLTDAEALPLVIAELTSSSNRPANLLVGRSLPLTRGSEETARTGLGDALREDGAPSFVVHPQTDEQVSFTREAVSDAFVFELSGNSPFLRDHKIAGTPVLPMAWAIELALAAARRTGAPLDWALHNFEVLRGIMIHGESCILRVEAQYEGDKAEVKIAFAENRGARFVTAYRGTVAAGKDDGQVPVLPQGVEGPAVLPVSEFYRKFSFHGPSLQGIQSISRIGDGFVEGEIRSSDTTALRGEFIDVLALDSAFQVCGYWARTQRNKFALPRKIGFCSIERIPARGSNLTCVATLVAVDEKSLRGHLEISDARGRVALLRDVQADFFRSMEGDVDEDVAAETPPDRVETPQMPATAPANYLIAEFPEVKELKARIQMAEAFGLRNPYFHVQEEVRQETSTIEGVEYVNFASYNYLGLSGDSYVNEKTMEAVQKFGTSVSASRVASGERPIHRELERTVADFLGCEDSVVMVGGHSTNVGTIGHILGPEDVIVHDSLAHDSILGGAKLSGARRRPFAHNDLAALEAVLKQVRPHARRVLIAVEGVYSMDGDIAPLPEIIALKKKYDSLLFVDEAHSLGVLGKTGRGIGEHFSVVRGDVDMWMGTLSKSLASCGGYIAGSRELVEFLKYTAPGFVYSVGISPANAAAAIASIKRVIDEPERVDTLRDRAYLLTSLFREYGIDVGLAECTGVVPCIVGNSLDSLKLAEKLRGHQINVQPILYPAVEENLARLRFFVTSSHTEAQIRETAALVRDCLMEINPEHLKRVPKNQKTASEDAWDSDAKRQAGRRGAI